MVGESGRVGVVFLDRQVGLVTGSVVRTGSGAGAFTCPVDSALLPARKRTTPGKTLASDNSLFHTPPLTVLLRQFSGCGGEVVRAVGLA